MLFTVAGVLLFGALWHTDTTAPTLALYGSYLFALGTLLAQAALLGFQVHGITMPVLQMRAQRTGEPRQASG